jgi:hypothetical protein
VQTAIEGALISSLDTPSHLSSWKTRKPLFLCKQKQWETIEENGGWHIHRKSNKNIPAIGGENIPDAHEPLFWVPGIEDEQTM